MGKRNGGISKEGKRNNIQENDVFFDPITAKIISYNLSAHFIEISTEKNNLKILDACANNGVLGDSVYYYAKIGNPDQPDIYYQDIKYDIEQTMTCENMIGGNILDYKPDIKFDIIICNPPWVPVELPEAIFHHLLTLLTDDGILFFVVNLPFFYQGKDRAKKLKFQKLYFLPRYIFKHMGRSLLDCGISVTHKDGHVPASAASKDCFIFVPPKINKDQKEFFDIHGEQNQ